MFGLNRLGVQSRFILLMLPVALGSILAIGWIGYQSARSAITATVQNHLQSLRASKTIALQTTLDSIRSQVISLSDGRMAVEAMKAFKQGYRGLADARLTPEQEQTLREYYATAYIPKLRAGLGGNPDPEQYLPADPMERYIQYHYVLPAAAEEDRRAKENSGQTDRSEGAPSEVAATEASPFGQAHIALRERFGRAAMLFGYEDMLLIDENTLEIVYSLKKRPDLATSLRDGPYAATNLARAALALSRAGERDAYQIVDIEPYRPALGKSVGFAVSPIFDGSDMVGILALEFPVEQITKLLTGNMQWQAEGMGESGECYLVGPDFTMRSRSRFMMENPQGFVAELRSSALATAVVDQIERQGNVLNMLPVKTFSVEQALQGREGITTTNDYRGVPVLSSYGPLDLESLRWAVVAEMDIAEAFRPIRIYARNALLAATALALATSILALVSSRLLVRPLEKLTDAAKRICPGELDVRVDLQSRDEFGELAVVFNEMANNLRRQRGELEDRARENQELLLNILPASAVELRRDGDAKATRQFADVTVIVAEFHGLDGQQGGLSDTQRLSLLSDVISACDEAAERCGVEKMRAVGAVYLAVCGLSVTRPDHAARVMLFAQEVSHLAAAFSKEHGATISVAMGINSGPVVGGVVGRFKFRYDLWGETVAIASRLAEQGAGAIRVTRPVVERLGDLYTFLGPTDVEVRGRGSVPVWRLQS